MENVFIQLVVMRCLLCLFLFHPAFMSKNKYSYYYYVSPNFYLLAEAKNDFNAKWMLKSILSADLIKGVNLEY